MPVRSRPVGLFALLVLSLLALPLVAQAQGNSVFFITEVNAAEFPQVRFNLRAVDLANQTIPNLNSVNVAVYENGLLVPEVEVTPHTDGPVNYIFVVDLGRQSNYTNFGLNNLRLAITTLVTDGFFVDGVDSVQVWSRQNINSDQSTILLAQTQTGADLINWAANFNFQRSISATKGLLAVEDALAALKTNGPPAGTQTTAVIFISRLIEEPRATVAVPAAETTAQLAAAQFVSVSVFHTDTSGNGRDPLQTLASGSNGFYVHLLRNEVVTAASDVYRALDAQRNWYTVAYRSALGISGTRLITINTAEAPTAGTAGRYDVVVELPQVEIVEPNPGSTIRREPALGADNATWIYPDITVPVTAAVTWPGGTLPRNLKSAQLLVDGVLQATAQPAPTDTSVSFDWDISDIVTPGRNTPQLEVLVTDELGLVASGPAEITIEVIPPPTPVPPTPEGPFQLPDLSGGSTRTIIVVVALALVGLLGALVLAGLVFFLTRPVQATKVMGDIRHTLLGGGPKSKQRVFATLKVIDGPKAWVGETINVTKEKTTFGRNPQAVDIPFYRDEESSISRVHATLQMDRNAFVLTDHSSTSGTRVNGEWLKPNDPVQLRDGDEIVLGDLTQRGVKLRFSHLTDKTELPAAAPPAKPGKPAEKNMWDGFKWDEDKWNEDE